MAKNIPTKYNQDQIYKAKELYMRYTPLKEIELQSNMAMSSIKYYAQQSWTAEREERKQAIIASFSSGKKVELTHIMRDGITALRQAVKATALRAVDLSLNEMTQLTKILESIDKIGRLDSGQATEITGKEEATKTFEVVNPFASEEIEEAEIVVGELDD